MTAPIPERIIIYLEPPTYVDRVQTKPACMATIQAAAGEQVSPASFTNTHDLAEHEVITTVVTASLAAVPVYWIAVKWPTECMVGYSCKLNGKDLDVARDLGVVYQGADQTMAKSLRCVYESSGQLTCKDDHGSVLSLDLSAGLQGGLCLTFALEPGAKATATFDKVFDPISIG